METAKRSMRALARAALIIAAFIFDVRLGILAAIALAFLWEVEKATLED